MIARLSEILTGMGVGIGILLILAIVLWGLGEIDKAARAARKRQTEYPTISRSDLDVEAANAECGIYSVAEHIRHRNKFEGRHYDAA